jgi:hypothetical protein
VHAPGALPVTSALRVRAAHRSGSSLPVTVDTPAGPRFTKLRGAAQGTAPLVAEVIVGALAEALGLRVPARSLVTLDAGVPSDDRNDELADLLQASVGVNLGFALLDGARDLRADDVPRVSEEEASAVVWLDALTQNPDRTARNPNLLLRHSTLWLIDHGAALGFQYDWPGVREEAPRRAWAARRPHVLAERATLVSELDELLAAQLPREVVHAAADAVPDAFLAPLLPAGATRDALARRRAAYAAYLWKRLRAPRPFLGAPGAS